MLVFVTAIKHPDTANNFRRVEELLEMSLRSVCSQTDPNFRVIVVTNRRPTINFHDQRVEYHVVNFPPPTARRSTITGFPLSLTDKGTKLLAGILYARRFHPEYYALFDADDLINRNVAAYVNHRPGAPGWYVDAGYVIDITRWRTERKRGLVRFCGTAQIPNAREFLRLAHIPAELDENASQSEIQAVVPAFTIEELLGNHRAMVGYFAQHGLRMKPLPFRATAWVVSTGENQTGTQVRTGGIPITAKLCREFGVSMPPIADTGVTFPDRIREALGLGLSWAGLWRERVFGSPERPHC